MNIFFWVCIALSFSNLWTATNFSSVGEIAIAATCYNTTAIYLIGAVIAQGFDK